MSEDNILNSGSQAPSEPVQETSEAAPVEEVASEAPVEHSGFLSEEMLSQGNLKDFNSADDLAKSYVELQRMVGNSVRIPGEDASAEAKQDFIEKIKSVEGVLVEGDADLYTRLGKPETTEGYDFGDLVTQEMIDANPTTVSQIDDFKDLALDLNLSSEQAKSLAEWQIQTTTQSESDKIAKEVQYREESMESLKSLWGNELGSRLTSAKQVIDIYGEKYGDAAKKLMDGPAGDNPVFINMLSELAELYSEKGHEGMSGAIFGMTPENAQLKMVDLRSDAEFQQKLNDKRHPGHKEAVKELQDLLELANGG